MNILLLGKGYVGSWLSEHLKSKHTVTAIKRSEIDYACQYALTNFLNQHKTDVIINCSGYTGSPNVDACEFNKPDCWFYNVVAPLNVLRAAKEANLPVLHVSSGCIYSGYEKEFTEEDVPNFGLYSNTSSYYSKCKHAFETLSKDYNVHIFRIRMPFDGTLHPKNYLNKLLKYDNLISQHNSLTCMPDLCNFVEQYINRLSELVPGIYNVVNDSSMSARDILEIFKACNIINHNWKIINLQDLKTVANRSNCVLSTEKIQTLKLSLPHAQQSVQKYVLQLAEKIK